MIQSSNYNEALQDPIFKIITQAAKELKVEAYVIGGFVRDFILERGSKKILILLLLAAVLIWL